MEASSKKPVPAFRDVIQAPKKVRLIVTCLESIGLCPGDILRFYRQVQ